MKKRLLYFVVLIIVFSGLLIAIQTFKRFVEPVPPHNPDLLALNTNEEAVIGFQITVDGKGIVYLTINEDGQNVYISDGVNSPVRLNESPIPGALSKGDFVKFASSYMDDEGNIYFESNLTLIEVTSDLTVKAYEYLSADLLYTDEELQNKTKSRLFNRIIEKYSNESIRALDTNKYGDLLIYIIDLDNGYYIESSDNPLKLERLTLQGESLSNVQEGPHLTIRYGARWDSSLMGLNEKAVIDSIIQTISKPADIAASSTTFESELPDLLETNTNYTILNGNTKAKISLYCYPNFFTIDGPLCKGQRIFLSANGEKIMLPNYEEGEKDSAYDSSFVYIPYDHRFFTEQGDFVFLSQNKKLYIL